MPTNYHSDLVKYQRQDHSSSSKKDHVSLSTSQPEEHAGYSSRNKEGKRDFYEESCQSQRSILMRDNAVTNQTNVTVPDPTNTSVPDPTNATVPGPTNIVTDQTYVTVTNGSEDDDPIQLSGVLEYVNSKYGVPKKQLKSLFEMGHYETHVIDSSGKGSGPHIKFPLESHICLPTPNHESTLLLENTPETPQMCTARKCSTLPRVNANSLVYASEHNDVRMKHNTLEFESRFESGNLSQAFQM